MAAALGIKAARAILYSDDSPQLELLDDSLSPTHLTDSTDVALIIDAVPPKLDIPVDSDLYWDTSDQLLSDFQDNSVVWDSDILAISCASQNNPTKGKLRKRQAALCKPDGAPQDFTKLKLPV